MNEGINLLEPNNNTGPTVFLRRLHTMRIVTVGLLFIVSVSSVILFILVALSPLPALERQQQSLEQTLSLSKNDIVKLSLVNSQADAINLVITKRQKLDEQIGLIENKLPKDVKITQIQTDRKSMVLTVEGASLQSLDSFLNGLIGYVQAKESFSNVTLENLINNTSNNAYDATVQLSLL